MTSMKSSKTTIDDMVILYEHYQEIKLMKTLCPEKYAWELEELEAEIKAHWLTMVSFIPVEVEWEIIKLTDKPLSRKESIRLNYHYWKNRMLRGIKNLHHRTLRMIKL